MSQFLLTASSRFSGAVIRFLFACWNQETFNSVSVSKYMIRSHQSIRLSVRYQGWKFCNLDLSLKRASLCAHVCVCSQPHRLYLGETTLMWCQMSSQTRRWTGRFARGTTLFHNDGGKPRMSQRHLVPCWCSQYHKTDSRMMSSEEVSVLNLLKLTQIGYLGFKADICPILALDYIIW